MNESVADTTFRNRLAQYSLSELEDVLTHLDRDEFANRYAWVIDEIEQRLKVADVGMVIADEDITRPPGIWRRLASSFVDISIQVVVPYIVLYFIVKVIYAPLGEYKIVQFLFPPDAPQGGGGGRRGGRGRGGGSNDIWSDITGLWDAVSGFFSGLFSGTPEAMATLESIATYFLVYLVFRLLWTTWGWVRSGATPGMRELGMKIVNKDDEGPSWLQAAIRFVLHHLLFVFTVGISALWMLWDRDKRALHDKIIGTKLVRVQRSWEKSAEDRRFD